MRTTKVRTLLSELKLRGCRPLRTRGSHQTWSTATGATFVVVVNHRNADASAVVLASVRRALRAENVAAGAVGRHP
jgi:predicted RNA binding protein YcfA (HicA-like mRNA interferase family)